MASRADKAAAMRAKILARSKDRMATVTGVPTPTHATQSESEASEIAAPSAAAPLSAADADAALEAALSEMGNTPAASVAPSANAPPSSVAEVSATPVEQFADPHEFPSSDELAARSHALSPASSGGADSDLAFQSFAQALSASQQQAQQPSYRRRQKASAAAAASTLDLPQVGSKSSLARWKGRVSEQIHETPIVRILTVIGVLGTGVAAGLGHLEGGVGWLLLLQLLAHSSSYLYARITQPKSRSTSARQTHVPTPSPPPPDSDAEDDSLQLDTDRYRQSRNSQLQQNALPGFPFPGMPQLGDLKGIGLPPALDTGLKALQLLMQYGKLMRQLLNDAFLFLFVLVCTNAALQLTYVDPVVYVA
jgi:hypothetical protein